MASPVAIAAAVVLAACSAALAWGFARRLGVGARRGRAPSAVLAVLLAAWALAASLAAVPLFALCAGAWAAFALAFCLGSKRVSQGFFAANLAFSYCAVSVLLAFSATASVRHGMMWQVVDSDGLRPLVVAVGLALSCLAGWGLQHVLARFPHIEGRTRSNAVLFWFGWFSVAYILADTLPSLLRLDLPILSVFVVCSMLLLGVSEVAFIVAASALGRDAHIEEEYLALVERRESQEARLAQLRAQVNLDALTGLVSRRAGVRAVEDLLDRGEPFAAIYIDMNGLKAVNDAFGHEAGDACLVRLADALRASFPDRATVCRMSGDEFFVVLPGDEGREAEACARKSLGMLASQPLANAGAVSFSYGIAVAGAAGESAASIVDRADRAMYRLKRAHHAQGGGA